MDEMAKSVVGLGAIGLILCAASLALALQSEPVPPLGKRSPPPEVSPVVFEGVRYEAPAFSSTCPQSGGCVVAYDNVTGAQLWQVVVYCTPHDPKLEGDVQDVFITSLSVEGDQLIVQDENSRRFTLDTRSRAIDGDDRHCEQEKTNSGCSVGSAPRDTLTTLVVGASLLILVSRSRRIRS